jgi:chaperone BCS1
MEKSLFKAIRMWIDSNTGLDLKFLVWTIALCVPTHKYGSATCKRLSSNLTNSVELDYQDALVTDLLIWISKQPSNQPFAWLPSFEHLEWKDLSNETKTADTAESNSYQLIASVGYTPFFHGGVPFLLYKPDARHYEEKHRLRCMWGSRKPIEALLRDVRETANAQMTLLKIIRVSARYNVNDTSRKRRLETIDMNPRKKQELLTDLQVFFAEGTEDHYWQNGTSYRRGYMFYGPAGTGKTSLSTAIASHYNLPLCVIDLAGMDDTILQDKVKNLPSRCVILFEDIDAAGVVRERTMVPNTDASDEGDETSSESESSDTWDTKPSKDKVKKTDSKKMNPSPSQSSRTEVTLSGLLNTLDGPGSREGHIVILTTNAPDSLDEALYRPGRIDTQVYLGFADQVTAGITFTRIFGSDKQVKESQKAFRNLGREFGRLLLSDFFTPAEIQKFCMNRRGQPQKVVDEFPGYIDEKRTGKTKFQYEIHRRAPKTTFHKEEAMHDDDSSDEVEYTPTDFEESFEGAHTNFPELSCISSTETSVKGPAKEQLFVTHGYEHDDDALAYDDYYPRRRGVWEDRLADDIVDICQGLRDMLAFTSVEPFRHESTSYKECRLQNFVVPVLSMGKGQDMSLSGTYCETDSIEPWVFYKPSIRPWRLSREHHNLRPNDIEEMYLSNLDSRTAARPSLPRSRPGATSLDESRSTLPSPTEPAEASSYYAPLSVGEQTEKTFQHHRQPSHPDVAGRRNVYPYHGPSPRTAEEDSGINEASPTSATVLLHNVDPQPLGGFEQLRLAEGDRHAVD